MVDSAKNTLNKMWRGIYETVVAPPTESKFQEKGTLTPAEFVEAGDKLIQAAPEWQWKPAATKQLKKNPLPEDKQFLLWSRVPSNKRIKDINKLSNALEKEVEGDWIIRENNED